MSLNAHLRIYRFQHWDRRHTSTATPVYMRFQVDVNPSNMSLKWIIQFVVDAQLVKYIFKKLKYFLSFEAGNRVSNSSLK